MTFEAVEGTGLGNTTTCHSCGLIMPNTHGLGSGEAFPYGWMREKGKPYCKDCIEEGKYLPGGKPMTLPAEPVHHPSHYTTGKAVCSKCSHPIECIDVTKHMNFCVGNAVKYLWRCDLKNAPIEDLEKARKYIDFEIARRKA